MRVFLRLLTIVIILGLIAGIIIYAVNTSDTSGTNSQSPGASSSSAPQGGAIILSEVMASNKSVLADEAGEYNDWVELYNTSENAVDLKGLTLTDDEKDMTKWQFPAISIAGKSYLVVFLSGKSGSDPGQGIIHSPVKLSAKGDKIILANLVGQKLDEYEFKSMDENVSHARIGNEWTVSQKPTPGYENSEAGYEALQKSMVVENPPVVISEVMTSNAITFTDNTGAYSDWVEIVNISGEDVNLNGCGLSDDPAEPLKWRFPDVTLKPLENLVVFCSGNVNATDQDVKKGLHSSFRLASYKETVTLSTARGYRLDQVTVENIPSDTVFARSYEEGKPTANWKHSGKPTPGYPNTDEGFKEFNKAHPLALGDVIISEVLASNSTKTIDGDTYDYIELTNRGSQPVDLTGYGLTTNAKNPAKFRFPEMTLQPGQQVLVLASDLPPAEAEKKNNLHAQFNLSMEGETLALFDAQGKLIDKCNIGPMQRNISIGRQDGKDEYLYFSDPTPGQPNGQGAAGLAGDVASDKPAGIYKEPIQVNLSVPDGCEIYYTTDGKTPTKNSKKYSGALQVDKTTVLRARAFKEGYLPGRTMTYTYFINPRHKLPLISIVTDPANLWDDKDGIFAMGPNANTEEYPFLGANFHNKWERPASFELFDENGKRNFNQDVAIRVAGAYSAGNQQKSIAIFARSEFGPSTMQYKFFEDLPYTEYKSVLLRNGGQDQLYGKIRDLVASSLVYGKMNVLVQAWKIYVVYINGEYWGVYFLREKRNEYFVAQHEGVTDPKSINLLWSTGTVLNGTNKGYLDLMKYIETHDMTQKENYDYVAARVDTDSFMDVMVNQIYIRNSDYNNLQYYQVPGGKWKQIYYDFCWTIWSDADHATLKGRMNPAKAGSTLLNGLLKYKPWRDKFIERFAWAIENIYDPDRFIETIDYFADAVRDEMPAERSKFTDIKRNWEKELDTMRSFAKKRGKFVVQQLKSEFSLSDEQKNMLDNALKNH